MSEEEEEDIRTLVIDNGSHTFKAGFAGDKEPTAVIPSVVGKPFFQGVMVGMGQKDKYIGAEAIAKRGILKLCYPIENNRVTDWDDMERVWQHIFYNELRACPEEHPVLLTEPVRNPRANTEKMVKIMFESFSVPLLYVARQPALALHSTGRSTGIVMEAGDGVTNLVPIQSNRILADAILHTDMAGRAVTDYLIKLLTEKGHSFPTPADREIARNIKEKLCYVALNTAEESTKSSYVKQSYKLPDGKEITIGDEQFWCPEALFQPKLIGMEMPSPHEVLSMSISKCPSEIRKELYSNIVLSGGSTLFPGFDKRLAEELNNVLPTTTNVKVVTPPKADLAPWLGGSMLGDSQDFHQMCISKEEYDESGPAIVHTKCQLY